jgi:SnoaL-like protein
MAEPHIFRRAAEAKDLELMREALAEDVILHSPVLFRGFEGRDAVLAVLSQVVAVFEDFAYLDELAEPDRIVLRFRARVGDRELEGIDYLELDADGRVAELTVFIRPLSALTVFAERMAERLASAPPSPEAA